MLLRYCVKKEQPNWTIVQTIAVASRFIMVVLVRCPENFVLHFESSTFALFHVFHFLHHYTVI